MANKKKSGEVTPFKDSTGKSIKVHDYVKDASGNRYYINSHHQAVPAGDDQDGAAIELQRLQAQGPVTIMTIEEVLKIGKPVEAPKRRGGRRPKADKPAEEAAAAAPENQEGKEAPAQEGQDNGAEHDPAPFDEKLVLSAIPDAHLAAELRRRGYVFAALKSVIIQI